MVYNWPHKFGGKLFSFFFITHQNYYNYQCMIHESHARHYNQLLLALSSPKKKNPLAQDIPKPLFFRF